MRKRKQPALTEMWMEGGKSVRLYRIGEFARKLGVTPDFLKNDRRILVTLVMS